MNATPLSAAESYSDCLTHPRSHQNYWTDLQKKGLVPAEMELGLKMLDQEASALGTTERGV